MTRGTFVLTNKLGEVLTSTEFNGDMNLDGYGAEAIKMIEKVIGTDGLDYIGTEVGFREKIIEPFNRDRHAYDDDEMVSTLTNCKKVQPFFYKTDRTIIKWDKLMEDEYTNKFEFLSDYLYWVNASDKLLEFQLKDDKKIIIETGQTAVINFGRAYAKFY